VYKIEKEEFGIYVPFIGAHFYILVSFKIAIMFITFLKEMWSAKLNELECNVDLGGRVCTLLRRDHQAS
jgi:hypothetical protein